MSCGKQQPTASPVWGKRPPRRRLARPPQILLSPRRKRVSAPYVVPSKCLCVSVCAARSVCVLMSNATFLPVCHVVGDVCVCPGRGTLFRLCLYVCVSVCVFVCVSLCVSLCVCVRVSVCVSLCLSLRVSFMWRSQENGSVPNGSRKESQGSCITFLSGLVPCGREGCRCDVPRSRGNQEFFATPAAEYLAIPARQDASSAGEKWPTSPSQTLRRTCAAVTEAGMLLGRKGAHGWPKRTMGETGNLAEAVCSSHHSPPAQRGTRLQGGEGSVLGLAPRVFMGCTPNHKVFTRLTSNRCDRLSCGLRQRSLSLLCPGFRSMH